MQQSQIAARRLKGRSIATTLLLSVSLLVGCSGEITSVDNKEETTMTNKLQLDQQEIKQHILEEWISSRDGEKLYESFSKAFQQEVTSEDVQQLLEAAWSKGEAPTLQSAYTLNGAKHYIWTNTDKTLGIEVVLQDNTILGMKLVPLESFETDQQLSKIAYQAPFEGQWFVFWGGSNLLQNYHYEIPSQRYAYDFVVTSEGVTYEGDPMRNESYFAFGQKVFATADGTVVHIEDQIADNEPVGKMNAEQPAGNVVVIDHGEGEYSYTAHLQKGSVQVKIGEQVSAGQWIGNCGNSGNSSEAHVHYQVSNSSNLFEGLSIPIKWDTTVMPSSPVKGVTISTPPQTVR